MEGGNPLQFVNETPSNLGTGQWMPGTGEIKMKRSAAEAYGGCEDDDSDSEHSLNAETAGNLQQMMDSQGGFLTMGNNGPSSAKKTKGRVKIKMEFIENKLRRYTTFSKRKTGIMKKAYELSTLTGTQVMLLVASETGHVYTFATRKLQPMITSESGKALIQTCLNSPDPPTGQGEQRMNPTGFEETELNYAVPDDDLKEDAPSSANGLVTRPWPVDGKVTTPTANPSQAQSSAIRDVPSFPMTSHASPASKSEVQTSQAQQLLSGGSITQGTAVQSRDADKREIRSGNVIDTGPSSGIELASASNQVAPPPAHGQVFKLPNGQIIHLPPGVTGSIPVAANNNLVPLDMKVTDRPLSRSHTHNSNATVERPLVTSQGQGQNAPPPSHGLQLGMSTSTQAQPNKPGLMALFQPAAGGIEVLNPTPAAAVTSLPEGYVYNLSSNSGSGLMAPAGMTSCNSQGSLQQCITIPISVTNAGNLAELLQPLLAKSGDSSSQGNKDR